MVFTFNFVLIYILILFICVLDVLNHMVTFIMKTIMVINLKNELLKSGGRYFWVRQQFSNINLLKRIRLCAVKWWRNAKDYVLWSGVETKKWNQWISCWTNYIILPILLFVCHELWDLALLILYFCLCILFLYRLTFVFVNFVFVHAYIHVALR